MDLMDFQGENLYFEEDLPETVEELIKTASSLYSQGEAEQPLLKALVLAPVSLNVLVSLYRFYYYQHRLEDALKIAEQALGITALRLQVPKDWQEFNQQHLQVPPASVALLRFHLFSFKAKAFLLLRLGHKEEAKAILEKLVALDENNRLGAKQLLEVTEIVEEED